MELDHDDADGGDDDRSLLLLRSEHILFTESTVHERNDNNQSMRSMILILYSDTK